MRQQWGMGEASWFCFCESNAIGSESMIPHLLVVVMGKSSYRFGPLRCDGGDDDDSDDNNSRPPQGLAEGLLEDVKSVLTELARGIPILHQIDHDQRHACTFCCVFSSYSLFLS